MLLRLIVHRFMQQWCFGFVGIYRGAEVVSISPDKYKKQYIQLTVDKETIEGYIIFAFLSKTETVWLQAVTAKQNHFISISEISGVGPQTALGAV